MIRAIAIALAITVAGPSAAALAEELHIVGFNLESGGSKLDTIARHVARGHGVDVWALSEVVPNEWPDVLRRAAERAHPGQRFAAIVGTTGGSDRLAIVFNASRLTALRHFELRTESQRGCAIHPATARAPLIVEFRLKGVPRKFWVMVNHLFRTNDAFRACQARNMNRWFGANTMPTIAAGDYNFDWTISTGHHDPAYDLFTASKRFVWIRPEPLAPTHCNGEILDFVFVAHRARAWNATSHVDSPGPGYCTRKLTESDHHPLHATIDVR